MVPQITIKRLRIIKRLRKPQPYRRDEEDVSDDMSNEMLERDSRAREEFTFTSDIPPAWLDLEPNNVAHRLGQLGYESPTGLEFDCGPATVKVVDKDSQSCYDASAEGGLCIREDESFASWWTEVKGGHKHSAVKSTSDSVSVYGTTITFERTLRVPDDANASRLPPSMGRFPVESVKEHAENLPDKVTSQGGYMLPMYQREALWLRFQHAESACNALKVSVGGINALTGALKTESGKPGVQDYLCKSQRWLDGIVKEEGKVKQFVAMPVGQGYTIEEQLTGENNEATLQLDIFPAFRRDVEIKLGGESIKDVLSAPGKSGAKVGDLLSIRSRTSTGSYTLRSLLALYSNLSFKAIYERRASGDSRCHSALRSAPVQLFSCSSFGSPAKKHEAVMGIGAGGSITQQIDKDTQNPEIYDFDAGKRIYIHFINAGAWKSITGRRAPITPVDKNAYRNNSLPWYDLYNEPEPAKKLGAGLNSIQGVHIIDKEHAKKTSDSGENVSEGEQAGEAEEALFEKRWKQGDEGAIIDIDASQVPNMAIDHRRVPVTPRPEIPTFNSRPWLRTSNIEK